MKLFIVGNLLKDSWGGVNIARYFALMLLDENVAMVAHSHIKEGFDFPLYSFADYYKLQGQDISRSLRQDELFFYQEGGSVFMDYKIMRDAHCKSLGMEKDQQMGKVYTDEELITLGYIDILGRFSPKMTTVEAFELCSQIVSQWSFSEDTN